MIGLAAQGLTLGFSASITPGPFQVFILSHTLAQGWRRTLPAAAAPLLTDAIIVPVVLFVLVSLPNNFLSILQIIGALFIFYLAWGAFRAYRAASSDNPPPTPASDTARRGFFKGALMNVLSPGPYIFWGTILGPIALKAWGESPQSAIAFVIVFYAAMIGLNAGLILLFGKAAERAPQIVCRLQGLAAMALLAFGIFQLCTGWFALVTPAA